MIRETGKRRNWMWATEGSGHPSFSPMDTQAFQKGTPTPFRRGHPSLSAMDTKELCKGCVVGIKKGSGTMSQPP